MSITSPSKSQPPSWFAIWTIPSGNYGRMRTILLVSALLASSFISYGVAYKICLRIGIHTVPKTEQVWVEPFYTIHRFYVPYSIQPHLKSFFLPAHQIDRLVRPTFWSPSPSSLLTDEGIKYYVPYLTPDERILAIEALGDGETGGIMIY